ncbi:peroxiredoxin-like family protein [Burkholderia multivorans]|uniref:peroxiredoxin-like family protein n=1 Tax=Burkholderia multivorans TaxID=87883 RepID=UPI001C23F4D0|nr:peroxiredoxin-like family protein [Burkholderia multivorans]MBU9688850.1 AhpC/TSA family protein [Burkholderia multivorans]MDN7743896.1 peroxiredoxin-like family protein [Burkholderia multivorans]MDR8763235.1 putative peroxiredoxin [Burkholderia multivorans]MDR8767860.1 putative peroxiredoxin [Burkholderia multivorans]MDR8772176.1 putative peroxiredoxin [Burkholderia multivorans]
MSLSAQIDALKAGMADKVPAEALQAMGKAAADLAASGITETALKACARAPAFELPDAEGRTVRLNELLKDGPVVLTFYRGQWCPFCNLTLAALQRSLPEIREAGAILVAVSPQTPQSTAATVKASAIDFPVLSDAGNHVARSFGLVFSLATDMRPIYRDLGVDLPAVNGDASYELPLAATYVIGQDGSVAYAFVDSDYTRRLEPAEIVRIVKSL